MRGAKLMLPAALVVMILTGCASVPSETKSACLVFEPICASRSDTEDTIKQIIGHNAAFEAVCGIEVTCR